MLQAAPSLAGSGPLRLYANFSGLLPLPQKTLSIRQKKPQAGPCGSAGRDARTRTQETVRRRQRQNSAKPVSNTGTDKMFNIFSQIPRLAISWLS